LKVNISFTLGELQRGGSKLQCPEEYLLTSSHAADIEDMLPTVTINLIHIN
jgi:hypothetical protein